MGIQELEKIATIINNLGSQAGDGFVTYLWFLFADSVLSYGLGFLIATLFFIGVNRFRVSAFDDARYKVSIQKVASIFGNYNGEYLSAKKIDDVISNIQKLKDKESGKHTL